MKKSLLRNYYFWAAVACLVFICFIQRNNLVNLTSAIFQLREQKARIEWYEKDISRLDSRIKVLESDVDSLETFARENFHFAQPGEDVFLVDE